MLHHCGCVCKTNKQHLLEKKYHVVNELKYHVAFCPTLWVYEWVEISNLETFFHSNGGNQSGSAHYNLTLEDLGKFVVSPTLLLISSNALSAAFALAIFLLFPDPLHFVRRPTLTSQVNSLVFDSPSSSTSLKITVSPTWEAASINKLTEFFDAFSGDDTISFISRHFLSSIV